jgi:hypothetical protein
MKSRVVQELKAYHNIAMKYGTEIELISTETPGTVIYEDDYQVSTIRNKKSD